MLAMQQPPGTEYLLPYLVEGRCRSNSPIPDILFFFTLHSFTHEHCLAIYFYPGKAMAPNSSTLAWEIPWTEEPCRLQSMGSLGVGHN